MMRCCVAKNIPWTDEEVEYVRQNYGKRKVWEIAEQLKRSESGVCAVALRIGLKRLRPHTREFWSEEELTTLRDAYPRLSRREVEAALPGHTWLGIRAMSQKEGLNRERRAVRGTFISEELQNIPPTAAAYLAGLVDGEGCVGFTLSRRKFHLHPTLGIANSDKRIIAFVEKWLPVLVIGEQPANRGQKIISRRVVYRASISGLTVGKVLSQIIPYMTAKKRRAEAVVEFCEIAMSRQWGKKYDARQIELYLFVRKANSRLGARWHESEEYLHLREYLISRRAPGIS
jgi:hypothetical protein